MSRGTSFTSCCSICSGVTCAPTDGEDGAAAGCHDGGAGDEQAASSKAQTTVRNVEVRMDRCVLECQWKIKFRSFRARLRRRNCRNLGFDIP